MNKYVGKKCPYCKGVIQETDEIVVCSVCDMPHHKECWIDNQGCTTFGCPGTISAPKEEDSKSDEEDFEIIFYDDPAPDPFGDGTAPRQAPPPPPMPAPGAYYPANSQGAGVYRPEESDMCRLIGPNQGYYISEFAEMTRQQKRASWNWSAFLITPYWMIYRKMYGYGAAMLGSLFLLSLLDGWMVSLLLIAIYITFGILGNYIYMASLNKKAAQLNFLSEPYKNDYIAKNGGTNTTAAVLSAVGYAVAASVIRLA